MKVVIDLVAESWDEIEASTLFKSQKKILSIPQRNESPVDSMEEQQGQSSEHGGEQEDNSTKDVDGDFHHEFKELGYSKGESDIHSWQMSDANDPSFQLMTHDEICEYVATDTPGQEESSEPVEPEQNFCPVSNSMAAHMLVPGLNTNLKQSNITPALYENSVPQQFVSVESH